MDTINFTLLPYINNELFYFNLKNYIETNLDNRKFNYLTDKEQQQLLKFIQIGKINDLMIIAVMYEYTIKNYEFMFELFKMVKPDRLLFFIDSYFSKYYNGIDFIIMVYIYFYTFDMFDYFTLITKKWIKTNMMNNFNVFESLTKIHFVEGREKFIIDFVNEVNNNVIFLRYYDHFEQNIYADIELFTKIKDKYNYNDIKNKLLYKLENNTCFCLCGCDNPDCADGECGIDDCKCPTNNYIPSFPWMYYSFDEYIEERHKKKLNRD